MAEIGAFPDKGMHAGQFGFQVDHGIDPVHVLEQGFELAHPVFPFVFHRPVGHAEMDHLGLVGPAHEITARHGEHFPAQEGPGIRLGQLIQGAAIVLATALAFGQGAEREMLDTAIHNGFGVHIHLSGSGLGPIAMDSAGGRKP